ncbi:MAG: RNA-binding domain-containing protein [Leifsonia sp.]
MAAAGPWVPESEDDLSRAIAEGTFGESHWLEAKRDTGDSKGERAETARDLASFGLDGGTLVIGVAEVKSERRFELSPVPLDGVREKVEQIAGSRIQPPLGIRVSTIISSRDPSVGYVVIVIPVSPVAPHMVDGRYYRRGDSTRQAMDDSEVRRLIQRRRDLSLEMGQLLIGKRDADTAAGLASTSAYFLARPMTAPHEMLLDLVNEPRGSTVRDLISTASARVPDGLSEWNHRLTEVTVDRRRGRRISFATLYGDDLPVIEVLFDERGDISAADRELGFANESTRQFYDVQLTRWLFDCVNVVAETSDRIDYRGPWMFAVLVDGLAGSVSALRAANFRAFNVPAYDAQDYFEAVEANGFDLSTNVAKSVRALVHPLLRALGSADRSPLLEALEPTHGT